MNLHLLQITLFALTLINGIGFALSKNHQNRLRVFYIMLLVSVTLFAISLNIKTFN